MSATRGKRYERKIEVLDLRLLLALSAAIVERHGWEPHAGYRLAKDAGDDGARSTARRIREEFERVASGQPPEYEVTPAHETSATSAMTYFTQQPDADLHSDFDRKLRDTIASACAISPPTISSEHLGIAAYAISKMTRDCADKERRAVAERNTEFAWKVGDRPELTLTLRSARRCPVDRNGFGPPPTDYVFEDTDKHIYLWRTGSLSEELDPGAVLTGRAKVVEHRQDRRSGELVTRINRFTYVIQRDGVVAEPSLER